MRSFPVSALVLGLLCGLCLTACETTPVAEPVTPPPAPAPVPESEESRFENMPAEVKPTAVPKPAAPARRSPAPRNPAASQSAPAATPTEVAAVPRPTPRRSNPEAESTSKLPVWMAGCSNRTQAAGAIQCDADALLVPPSAKVRVYAREASLIRSYPDGFAIQLREGLPKRYRFFVLP